MAGAEKKNVLHKNAGNPALSPAQDLLNVFGVDNLCGRIVDGMSMTSIAAEVGVSIGTLIRWIEEDPARSARARESRTYVARYWDEMATKVIQDAGDQFELAKAKEIAHHYRWRSSKTAPREYGDKLDTTTTTLGADGKPITPGVAVYVLKVD